ncbi:MAG: hypothetical protein ACQ5SW_14240 [Sphaerochaetaceae bacterium]
MKSILTGALRREKYNKTLVFLFVVVLFTAVFALQSWFIMLIWGALGSSIGFFTIGYGQAVLITAALSIVGSFLRTPTTTRR